MKIFDFLLSLAIFILCYMYINSTYGVSVFDFMITNKIIFSSISLKKIVFVLCLSFVPFVHYVLKKKSYFFMFLLMMVPLFVDFFIFEEKTVEEFGFQGQGPFDENSCFPSVEKDGIYLHTCFCNTTNSISKAIEFPFWSKGLYINLCAGESGGDGVFSNITLSGFKKQVHILSDSCVSVFFPKTNIIANLKIESGVFGKCNNEDTIVREIFFI